MDLAQAVEQLYAGDPDEFVAVRKVLAAEARDAKDRELAKQIEAFRKPTRSAWLVNLLARAEGRQLAELLDLAPALAEAHTTGGAGLRQLMALRRQAVEGLVEQALALGREHGYTGTDAVRAEVQTILNAALTQPDVGQVVRAGAITVAPESAAAFPTDLFAALAPVIPLRPEPDPDPEPEPPAQPEPEPEPPPAPAVDPAVQRAAQRALTRAELDLEDARDAVAGAEQDAASSASALAEARTTHDELAAQVAELEARLTEAAASLAAVEAQHTQAADRHSAALDQLAAAEQAVASAQVRLADLDRTEM